MLKMKRREFLKIPVSAALASIANCCSCLLDNQNKGTIRQRPNIIFMLTDDQRWDALGCAGNKFIQTPNMDTMASEGIRFSNAFVTSPICCASRASIFTGQYARHHGIHDFVTELSSESLAMTYPALLRKNGYRTGFIGKYGVGTKMPESEFDVWRGIEGQPLYEQIDKDGNIRHLTGIMGEQCLNFIRACNHRQPFCLSISFKAPHAQDGDPRQFIYDGALEEMYKDIEVPQPLTASEKYFNSLAPLLQDPNTEARKRWVMRFSTPERYQNSVKGYYRLITGVDRVIGSIRHQLEISGFSENTIIIFMSDNGFFLGEKGLAGKWYPYEESIRVPLIIYDPRLPKNQRGRVISEIALNIDIAPTILEYAGISAPVKMQGKNLSLLMSSKDIYWRKDFLIEHLFDYEPIPKSEAVRTKEWKYLRFLVGDKYYEELYYIKTDPHETQNLSENPEYLKCLNMFRILCDNLIETYI